MNLIAAVEHHSKYEHGGTAAATMAVAAAIARA
jgi:hypothetical protein